MGAVWQSTSAAAPIKPAAKPAPPLLFSKPVPNTLQTAALPIPAPAVVSDDSDQHPLPTDIIPATAAATAVAVYRPYHAVGTCHITVLPTAVIQLPASIPWQAAINAAEMSTAVAVYRSTQQPLTSWANIFQPFTSNGSTAVVNLLLSKASVESLDTTTRHKREYRETQAKFPTTIFNGQNMTQSTLGTNMSVGMYTTNANARL